MWPPWQGHGHATAGAPVQGHPSQQKSLAQLREGPARNPMVWMDAKPQPSAVCTSSLKMSDSPAPRSSSRVKRITLTLSRCVRRSSTMGDGTDAFRRRWCRRGKSLCKYSQVSKHRFTPVPFIYPRPKYLLSRRLQLVRDKCLDEKNKL